LADSRKVWLAGARALGTPSPAASRSTKPSSSKSSKSGKKRSSGKSGATPVVNRSVVPTQSAVLTRRTGLKPAQLQQVAKSLPALGQPPAMQKLYLELAKLAVETERADRARVAFLKAGPTRSSLRTLRDAETRLVRAISAAERLLAAAQ
jgi:hypothetical protein